MIGTKPNLLFNPITPAQFPYWIKLRTNMPRKKKERSLESAPLPAKEEGRVIIIMEVPRQVSPHIFRVKKQAYFMKAFMWLRFNRVLPTRA